MREKPIAKNHEWLTPPEIIKALGVFDLDPCSPIKRPWDTARKHYDKNDDGLQMPWYGRVWCNPPYGKHANKWIEACAEHGNAIVLTFARIETKSFFDNVWEKANAIFIFKGRLQFYTPEGVCIKNNAAAPSVLIAYGKNNATALQDSGIEGKLICL